MSLDSASEVNWYDEVRGYTTRLVGIRSVSPAPEEDGVTREVVRILSEDGLAASYAEIGLDALAGDPHHRHNAYAYLPGASARTIILLGHIDTVATADYGALEPYALDPDALTARRDQLLAMTPELRAVVGERPDDWMFGRGTIDMKAGVAANIAVMRYLARLPQERRPVSAVLLATPDEENESAGVLRAVRFLTDLRERHRLTYLGAINTDYTTARYSGDTRRYIYTGTVGKLLVSFFAVGAEGHAGDPFQGLDANLVLAELVRDLSMNVDLCEQANDRLTPPPVTLHASDLKSHYDVQLPFTAFMHLNVLTFTRGPDEVLADLTRRAGSALESVLDRVSRAERAWRSSNGLEGYATTHGSTKGAVLTYAELSRDVASRMKPMELESALAEEWARWPAALDKRERALHMVERMWTLSGRAGPAVVVYFSPPYYPFVSASPCELHSAARRLAEAHPELELSIEEYYPYLSDMSYLQLDERIQTQALTENMPVWTTPGDAARPGGYSLPLEEIHGLATPVINLGPYGGGAHQRGERLLMPYTFDTLPRLLVEMLGMLAEGSGRE